MTTKKITLDVWKKNDVFVTVIQGETNARFLEITIKDGSKNFDLTGKLVQIYFTKPDGKQIFKSAEILDAANGLIRISMTQQMLDMWGIIVDGQIRIQSENQEVLKITGLKLNIKKDSSDVQIESTDEFTALNDALSNVALMKNHITSEQNPHNITTEQIGAISSTEKAQSNGVATLDSDGKLVQKPTPSEINAINISQKGAINGVAALNSNGKLISSQLDISNDDYKIKLLNLSEEVQSAMAGTTPVIASVADESLTTAKYSNNSITNSKIADHAINADKLDNDLLLSDYIIGNGQEISLPISNTNGSYKVSFDTKSNVYITNKNMFDLLGYTIGTYTYNNNGNNISVTIDKFGEIIVLGTITSNALWFKLDSNEFLTSSSSLGIKNYDIPNFDGGYTLRVYDSSITTNTGTCTIAVRKKTGLSGNEVSIAGTDQGFTYTQSTITNTEDWGGSYLYFSKGNYDLSFKPTIYPTTFVTSGYEVVPNSTVYKDIKEQRLISNNQIISSDSDGNVVKLEKIEPVPFDREEIYVNKSADKIDFYIKGTKKASKKYLKYSMVHNADEDKNCNSWNLHECYIAERNDNTFTTTQKVVKAGEWECALQIVDRNDFIGGVLHGDEIYTDFRMYVDGNKYQLSNIESFTCKEIKFVEISNLYDPNDHTTIVATHFKEYTITQDGIDLSQEIKWLDSYNLTYSYLGMLPTIRGNDSSSAVQITSYSYDDLDFIEYDISNAGNSSQRPHDMKAGVSQFTLYGNDLGFSAQIKVLERDPYIPNCRANISGNESYNKVYFDYCGQSYQTSPNEKWKTRCRFSLNVSE